MIIIQNYVNNAENQFPTRKEIMLSVVNLVLLFILILKGEISLENIISFV